MTDQPNPATRNGPATVAVAGIGGVLAMLAANVGLFDWFDDKVHAWIGRPQLTAMVVGTAVGVAWSHWIPYVFKAWFCADRVRALIYVSSSALTFAISWRMSPTEFGAFYSLFAAFSGVLIYEWGTAVLYKLVPWLKPAVLRE